jgi:uncharacterized membrane protein
MNWDLAWESVKIFFLLIVVDLPWLFASSGWSVKLLRRVQLAPIEIRWWAAAVVYVALTGLVLLAKDWRQAAAIGVATYAVYEFTNLSTFVQWDWRFSVADSLWGGVLLGTVKWLSGM